MHLTYAQICLVVYDVKRPERVRIGVMCLHVCVSDIVGTLSDCSTEEVLTVISCGLLKHKHGHKQESRRARKETKIAQ